MTRPRRTRTRLARAALGLLLLTAGAATAAGTQEESAAVSFPGPESINGERAPNNDILVTGTWQGSDEAVDTFVATVLAETSNGRVARWSDRICLNVEGGSAELGHYFAARIADVANELGIEVLTERRCEPSAYIIFTREPHRLLERLAEERPAFFGSIASAQREQFRMSGAPVRWVSHSQLRAAHGEDPTSFYIDPKKGGMGRPVPAMRVVTPSRLTLGSRMDLSSMLIVVDASQLSGISNRSLSAYLAMVVLGNVRPDHGEVRQPTILDIFGPERSPGVLINADLTDWDLAYLRSLYQGNWNMTSEQRIRHIQASMARNLEGGNP